MSDLISRQAAIDAIKEWGLIDGLSEGQAVEILEDEGKVPSAQPEKVYIANVTLSEETLKELVEKAKAEIVQPMPTVIEPEQRWIPCSERLPDKSGRYLVTNTRLGAFEVTWNIFYNGKGEAPEGWLYEDGTIAWMPLPEPYKEGEDDEG